MADLEAGRELDALVAEKVMGLNVARATAPAVHVEGDWSVYPATDVANVGPESGWICYSGMEPVFVRQCGCDVAAPELRMPDDWLIESSGGRAEAERKCAEWYAEEVATHKADLSRWGHSHHCLEVVPHYSTNIAAAWEVVEKLRPIYHCYLCAVRGNVGWTMQFANNAPPHAEALAETAPLAICRAALKAVGHDG